MKTIRQRYSGILILLLTAALSTYASNKLAVVRTTTNTLEVQLTNSEEVYGLQFSLRTSSDIVLGKLERGARTSRITLAR